MALLAPKKVPGSKGPYFYTMKRNGWQLITASLERRGWQRLPFHDDSKIPFDLRWVQGRSQINFVLLKDGQLVNHIPNNDVITTKLGLLETLRGHFGNKFPPPWFPESYRLDQPADAQKLLARNSALLKAQPRVVWILKPSDENRGVGIRLVGDEASLRRECGGGGSGGSGIRSESAQGSGAAGARKLAAALKDKDNGGSGSLASTVATAAATGAVAAAAAVIVDKAKTPVSVAQLYLLDPLLLDGRKFDLRVYGLVARASPGAYLCLGCANGYARLSLQPYSLDDLGDTFAHLTNASVQKRHADYKEQGGSSLWSMAMVEESLVGCGVCEPGWATAPTGGLQTQAKVIMTEVLAAATKRFQRKEGYFDLLGFDLIVDEALKVHLLEVNTNPALLCDNHVLEALLPTIVDGTLQAVLEAHGRPTADVIGSDAPGGAAAGSGGAAAAASDEGRAVPNGFEVLIDEKRRYEFKAAKAKGTAPGAVAAVKAGKQRDKSAAPAVPTTAAAFAATAAPMASVVDTPGVAMEEMVAVDALQAAETELSGKEGTEAAATGKGDGAGAVRTSTKGSAADAGEGTAEGNEAPDAAW